MREGYQRSPGPFLKGGVMTTSEIYSDDPRVSGVIIAREAYEHLHSSGKSLYLDQFVPGDVIGVDKVGVVVTSKPLPNGMWQLDWIFLKNKSYASEVAGCSLTVSPKSSRDFRWRAFVIHEEPELW